LKTPWNTKDERKEGKKLMEKEAGLLGLELGHSKAAMALLLDRLFGRLI
jgi:hypothetical protein